MEKSELDKQKKKQISKIVDYQRVFSTEAGKRVLRDLMRTHFMLSTSASDNPYTSYFQEGERSVVIRILQKMKVDVVKLDKLIEEANNDADDE